jgi:hypothetical protein
VSIDGAEQVPHAEPESPAYDGPLLDGIGGEPPEDPGARRIRLLRARNIVFGVVLVLAVCLAVIFGPTMWQVLREKNTTVETPDRVAALSRDSGADAQSTVDYLKTAVDAGVPLNSTVGAVYTDAGTTQRSVFFVGGTGLFLSPDKQLNSVFGLIRDQTGGVDGVRAVPAGKLGGVMKCGTTKTDEGVMSVCGWADHGSLAVALFSDRSLDESAHLLLTMRNEMQHRN